jgi:PAS domain S-box-containing protein
VLVVEDDQSDAELAVAELRRSGFTVHADIVAKPGRFAAHLREHTYDLVLADYRLPGWTGVEALEQLRELGHDIPLILVTGTLGEERAVECLLKGAADYILKDNLARLPIAVRRAVSEANARREFQRTQERMRAAEREVHDRDERFRQLAENISEVFYLADAQYREMLYINPAYERVFGRSCQNLYDDPRSFLEPIHPDDLPILYDNIARVQRGEDPGTIEFRVVRPNGSIRWVLSHAIPVRDVRGEVYRICGIALDTTEQRSAREALIESVARFRILAEASFDAISVMQDGILREVNPGFVSIFGYDGPEDIVGRPATDFVAEESRPAVAQRIGSGQEGTYEMVGLRRDGKRILLEATARSHTIDGGAVRITALRDLTERRMLEAQFRQAQKMEAVGRLAGGIAHDFNNLLTVISGHTDLLLQDVVAGDPRREDLRQVRLAADSAAALTRQLLAFSRQQVIEPRNILLSDCVARTKKLMSHMIGEDIELTVVLEPDCLVHMDPSQLEQVIVNLAVNARDAMPQGGKLTIETSILELDEELAHGHGPVNPGRYAVLAVTDTGVGMDAATRERVFEPFFTTKEAGKGTGLGLATVYGIVKQNSGTITVYSEPGVGTCFKIYLPHVLGEAVPEIDVEDVKAAPRGTETILLVEDSESVRQIAHRVLARNGYDVIVASTAPDAIDFARTTTKRIHLLLTDLVMPHMSGRVVSERLATLCPDAKVLYMSGYTDDAAVRHGVLSAGVPYLQKPFTPYVLACKVREVLDGPRHDVPGVTR